MCQTRTQPNATRKREYAGREHLDILRAEQHAAALHAVRHHAAEQGEEEDRDAAEKLVEPQQEFGMVGKAPDQPTLRDNLHPRADGGGAGTDPHQTEIAVMEGLEDFANYGEQKWIVAGSMGPGMLQIGMAAVGDCEILRFRSPRIGPRSPAHRHAFMAQATDGKQLPIPEKCHALLPADSLLQIEPSPHGRPSRLS